MRAEVSVCHQSVHRQSKSPAFLVGMHVARRLSVLDSNHLVVRNDAVLAVLVDHLELDGLEVVDLLSVVAF